MRCVVCFRLPDEEHCVDCHYVHDRLKVEPLWAVNKLGNKIGVAKAVDNRTPVR